MKREVAGLLRAVLRLVEEDVRELAEAVVEIDEREADHWQELVKCRADLADLAALVRNNTHLCRDAHLYGVSTRDMFLQHAEGDTGQHPTKVPA